jgi:cell division protease FtsH
MAKKTKSPSGKRPELKSDSKKTTSSTKKKPPFKEWRNFIWYFLFGLLVLTVLTTYSTKPKDAAQMDFSSFMTDLSAGQISEVTIQTQDQVLTGVTTSGEAFKTYYIQYPELVQELREKGVSVKIDPNSSGWVWGLVLQALLPFILIGVLWFFIFRQAQGANSQAMTFGKSRAVQFKREGKPVTFKDVAGADEAIVELREIVDFLKAPQRFQDIGAKIPKGVLMMGPPGTGKTLLARAVAGEAEVPFFSLSGSDFVEMFVGVGASRVRDLFQQAKKVQPCIIFLDEIDAVGRQRGAGVGGGHDEREQTLNQLLVEMDGFDPKQTVIVIAASNRPDVLDPALLRPGRFDRQVVVDKPDIKGRRAILDIHVQGKKTDKDLDLDVIAKRTPGFTGADLANLLNEAALMAARQGKKIIQMTDVEAATDRVIAGPERKSKAMNEKEKEIVAYHEVGHALVAKFCQNTDPVHKISILPRGRALGYTLQLPQQDKYLMSRAEIEDQIKVLMGGRIAEDLKFQMITSGASNDIERATELARGYICNYGMSERLGARKYGKSQGYVFMAKDYGDHSKDYSEGTAREIDEEIRRLIDVCYAEAKQILIDNFDKLEEISKEILEKEVLDGKDFEALLSGVSSESESV